MSHHPGNSTDNIMDDRDLWRSVASRLDAMCERDRKEWEPVVETLRERDRMTVQALRLAESGLKMMARNVRRMEEEQARLSGAFRVPIGPIASHHVRMDPQPGSGGCMWIS
ncbi:hypothetical protein GC170_19490 [bacterium]|nr:hypothetical protein [bacterium]